MGNVSKIWNQPYFDDDTEGLMLYLKRKYGVKETSLRNSRGNYMSPIN